MLHLVVHMKIGRSSCVRHGRRELVREVKILHTFSPLHWPVTVFREVACQGLGARHLNCGTLCAYLSDPALLS